MAQHKRNKEKENAVTDEAMKYLEEYSGYISREDTNKILRLANVGFQITSSNKLSFALSRAGVDKETMEYVKDLHSRLFADRITAVPIKIVDKEEELDVGKSLVLRLTVPIRSGEATDEFTLDLFLEDMLYESTYLRLLGILYYLHAIQPKMRETLPMCRHFVEVQNAVRDLEDELFGKDYKEYLKYQVHSGNLTIVETCGESLHQNDLKLGNGVTYMFMGGKGFLFEAYELTHMNTDLEYILVPKSFEYAVVFYNELMDTEGYLSVGEDEDIPTKVYLPEIQNIFGTWNIYRLETYIKHLLVLGKLKRLKKRSVGDWEEIEYNHLNIPHFDVAAQMMLAQKSNDGLTVAVDW